MKPTYSHVFSRRGTHVRLPRNSWSDGLSSSGRGFLTWCVAIASRGPLMADTTERHSPKQRIETIFSQTLQAAERRRLLRRTGFLPSGKQCPSVEHDAAQIHTVDLTGVADVLQRIGIEHDEIGALAGGEHPHVLDVQQLGRRSSRGHDCLRRRESKLHPSRELVMIGRAERVTGMNAGIRTKNKTNTGGDHFRKIV